MIDSFSSAFVDEVRKQVRDRIHAKLDLLSGGNISTWDKYKYEVGFTNGLRELDQIIEDVKKQFSEEDKR